MNLAKKLLLFALVSTTFFINIILSNTTVFAGINEVFAVTNNTTDFGGNTALSNNTILVKPSSLEAEHKEVHEKLEKIVSSSGDTANIAKQVQSIMQPHFEKEEQLSIPVLGALQPYVNGILTERTKNQAIQISQQFKQEYPTMLEEHKQIVAALDNLENTAMKENRQDVISFIADLKSHAMNEEQVTYPATIVIGELLELKK
ncbi:MAG TPA: hemerythrin domain-containing protein [Nitrososphaeraceae archaeon]|nr:hemerythrin domain-containing protein [Nitrososphaeraceae archaeon]